MIKIINIYICVCVGQGLEPEPKEPIPVPVLDENLGTGTFLGIYILYFVERESEPY
jgi:hypothetical protein